MAHSGQLVGEHLREWRQRRRLSQLDLACEAGISSRHLSFVETGRSRPSRDMILHLARQLDIPLRERNMLLTAAGYAAVFPERPLSDPALEPARQAVELVISGHDPYPALAVDRHWTMVSANAAGMRLFDGVDPALLRPPANVLRLYLHPNGLAPRIANLAQWREHLLGRLRRHLRIRKDTVLSDLARELSAYAAANGADSADSALNSDRAEFVVPIEITTRSDVLSLFSTTTLFGTPVDITLSEIALECFYPANAASTEILKRAAHM